MVGGGLECQSNSGIRSVGQQHSFLWWHGSDCWPEMIRMQHEIWILMNMVVELYKSMSIFLLLFYITLLNVRKLWTRIIESKNLSYKYRSTLMKPIELHSLVVDDVNILGYRCGFDLVPFLWAPRQVFQAQSPEVLSREESWANYFCTLLQGSS